MNTVRVLYMVASGDVMGGVEVHLLKILQYASVSDFGIQPVGVLVPSDGRYTEQLRRCNLPVGMVQYYGWHLRSPWRYAQTFTQLLAHVRRFRPDIVHCTHHWLVDYAARLRSLSRHPVVCELVNIEDKSFIRSKERSFAALDRVVAHTKAVETSLLENSSRQINVTLIRHGLDISQYIASPAAQGRFKSELGLSRDVPLVGFVGRLVPEKGVEDLLQAWSQVRSFFPEAYLVFVGEDAQSGVYQVFLRRLSEELGISSSVFFVGFHNDIPTILPDIDILVLPSHMEAFGYVLLEAMAAGSLIVATEVGGIPEVVNHRETGFLVPPRNPHALAQAVCHTLALPFDRAKEMRMTARERVKNFDICVEIKAYAELYRQLLA